MNILQEIARHKRAEVQRRKAQYSVAELSQTAMFRKKSQPLSAALQRHPHFGIIAEIKKRSPTGGNYLTEYEPWQIGVMYEQAGASAVSVLTDEKYFSGSLDDLRSVRSRTALPLLRKDFILDEIQLYEAKAFGADAVLLIAALLDKHQLKDLHTAATALDLETLIELYESKEIDNIDFDLMKLIGINNRNLKSFETDLRHTQDIASLLPEDTVVVSESGIGSVSDLLVLRTAGIRSALIGETFMKSSHPGEALRSLLDGYIHATQS